MKLIPHPAFPPGAIEAVEVAADIRHGVSVLTYRVLGDSLAVPEPASPLRTNDLWQHTCFELFVQPRGSLGYFEFNFSPSTAWAAYRFDAYRAGMADCALAAPNIEWVAGALRVTVDLGALPAGEWRVGLTAVIEERDGTRSFWAQAHPPEKPDFHDPACFALELPAANAP